MRTTVFRFKTGYHSPHMDAAAAERTAKVLYSGFAEYIERITSRSDGSIQSFGYNKIEEGVFEFVIESSLAFDLKAKHDVLKEQLASYLNGMLYVLGLSPIDLIRVAG